MSSEARQVAAMIGTFVAGAALAWAPLTDAPVPFRETSRYPVWVFLEAVICGLCPYVWTTGRRALGALPVHRRLVREVLGYSACAVVAVVATRLIGRELAGDPKADALPYVGLRLTVIYLAVALAVAPGIIAMYRVARGCGRVDEVRPAELVAWREILQAQLSALGALVMLGTLATAAMRNAGIALDPANADRFPAEYVLLFGAGLTLLLALAYVPPSERLRRRAQMMVDQHFPVPDRLDGDWQQQLERRRNLAELLRTGEGSRTSIQNALIVGGPLITSALTLLIPT